MLKDDANAYFHHQVLEYMNQLQSAGVGSRDMRTHTKGWQIGAQGIRLRRHDPTDGAGGKEIKKRTRD